MVKIKELEVVVAEDASNFEDSLKEQVNNMQKRGLEVTINNPHVVKYQNTIGDYLDHYIAVVEGYNIVK